MFTKYISKNIQEKMKAKERALARKTNPNNEGNPLSMKDMATRTPFVRMASNKSNSRYNKLIEGGLRADDFNNKQFGFDGIYEDFGRVNEEKRPMPGIKSIECSYKGGFKAIRECTVSWVVPHIDMLNELTPHFFTVGKTVVVDWGWVYGNQNLDKQLVDTFITFTSDTTVTSVGTNEINKVTINQNIFNNPQDLILKKNGDYDAIGGQITNFEYNLRDDGGFDCTTKIISMGASLFKKPIDKGGNQAGFKVSGDNAKSTPPDSLINCVLNLRNIILNSSFGITSGFDSESYKDKMRNSTLFEADAKQTGFKKDNHSIFQEGEYSINVDNKNNPNVLWTVFDKREEMFVTWGWMEDNIINRYVSFEAGDDRLPKLTMRSIDTILDESGLPISTGEIESDSLDFETEDFIDKYDLDLEDVKEFNAFLKTETLIRNPPGLYPVNPFLFFIPETIYPGRIKISGITLPLGKFGGVEIKTDSSVAGTMFYDKFLNLITTSDNKVKRFSSKKVPNFGKLRNIWVNIKEIQKAFGISDSDSDDTSTSNINPPGTIEVAMNNLLTSLNTNFHNIWDFEIGVDPYDSTNIKVIDKSDSEIKNPQYTKYQENNHLVQDSGGGIFQFPTFKAGSFVKSQNLTFKIPDAQAITILYGSNKPKGDNDPEFANGQLDKLFRNDKTDEFDDAYLKNMKSSHQNSSGEKGKVKTNVGSQNVNPNSRISFTDNFGIRISPKNSSWWKQWTPDIENESEDTTENGVGTGYYEISPNENGLEVLHVQNKKPKVVQNLYKLQDDGHIVLNSRIQNRLNSYLNSNSPVQQFDMSNLVPAELGLEIDGTGGIIPFELIHTDYIEEKYKSELISYAYVMQGVTRDQREQGFSGASQPGDDTLQQQTEQIRETEDEPKAELGPLTYFQLFDVTHKVDGTGWKTELNSKMRINHIPRDDFVTFEEEEDEPVIETKPLVATTPAETPVATAALPPQEIRRADGTEVEVEYVPAPVSRPNIPIPPDDEDIEDDVELEELDFDDIPPWIPPPYPSTLTLRRAKTEIQNNPERVPGDEIPPDVKLLDVGPVMGPAEIDKLIANAVKSGTSVNNDTDLVEYPPEPDPRAEPALPSQPIRRGGDYGNLNPLSLLEQIKSQKIIYVQPSPELTNETGEVEKPQRFEAPQVQEVDYVSSPVEVAMAVNESIKEELPDKVEVVTTPPEEPLIEVKSTYNFSYEQNQILYSIREDWRPLYLTGNPQNPLSGARKDSDGNERTLVRSSQPKEVRKEFWDVYIEAPNESGISKTKYIDRFNKTIFPQVTPTGDLIREDRNTYWYGEFNPSYTGSPPS